MLNEGLEVLGVDERTLGSPYHRGVFEGSGLKRVRLPSTLKRIEFSVFLRCSQLQTIRFPNGLEYIGTWCFGETGLERVEFPASLRTVAQEAFSECKSLRTVKFSDGLEVLGTSGYQRGKSTDHGVFQGSALEAVRLPSTLRRIEYNAFRSCRNLKHIALPERLEYIGAFCFCESALESLVVPPSVREIEDGAFCDCRALREVKFSEGIKTIKQGVFMRTAIECLQLPSSLRRIA